MKTIKSFYTNIPKYFGEKNKQDKDIGTGFQSAVEMTKTFW